MKASPQAQLQKRYLEAGESVGSQIKVRLDHIVEKSIEIIAVKNDPSQRLVVQHLSQHRATIQRNLWKFVSTHREKRERHDRSEKRRDDCGIHPMK
jgi:hypothetical protein